MSMLITSSIFQEPSAATFAQEAEPKSPCSSPPNAAKDRRVQFERLQDIRATSNKVGNPRGIVIRRWETCAGVSESES